MEDSKKEEIETDFQKLIKKQEEEKKPIFDLFTDALNDYYNDRFTLEVAEKLVQDIDNLGKVQKHYLSDFIENNKYWVLIKSHPNVFEKYLLECYENETLQYMSRDTTTSQLIELGDDTASDIFETIFNKYPNDSGVIDQRLNTRGKTSENLAKLGEIGQKFLLDHLNDRNSTENDKYCALFGLSNALYENYAYDSKKIIQTLRDNLKSDYSSVKAYSFWILLRQNLITLDDINDALGDSLCEVRKYAVKALFRLGIKKETAKALSVALEDSRTEVSDLVLNKLSFERPQFIIAGEENVLPDSISIDEVDQVVSIIIDELIVRSSGRPKEIFNSEIVASALEKLFVFNPQLQSKTLYQLCEIAFQNKGSTRNRAVFVGGVIDKGKFAALVKERVEDQPNDAKAILEIAGASLDTSSIATRISETDPKDIQQNAANQIKLLENYHKDGLQQAKTSFMWALILSGLSLVCLMVTLYLLISSDSQNIINVLTAVGTIFSQFLAATQFYLYNQTRKQLTYYHQQMNQIQKFLLANSVAEQLEGEAKEKSRIELVRMIATMDQTNIISTKE